MAPQLNIQVQPPDLRFLAARVPSLHATQARHVKVTGDNANNGRTESTAWKTIAHAVQQLQPGQVLYVHPGVYKEKKILTTRPGRRDRPIRVIGLSGAVISGSGQKNSGNFIELQHNFWTIENLEVDAKNKGGFAVYFHDCQYAMIRGMHIHHCKMGAAVTLVNARDIAIIENVIYCTSRPNQDGHGITVQSDSARVLIKDNTSWGNSGDSVQCELTKHGNNRPTDITIEGNRFHDDDENAVDLKRCSYVLVQRNKFYGYKGRRKSSKQGAAIVCHRDATTLLFQYNRIWNCGLGASFGSDTIGSANNIVFRRNLLFNMKIEPSLDKGTPIPGEFTPGGGIRVSPTDRIEVYHNTFYNFEGDAIKLGDDDVVGDIEFTNNIVMNCRNYISIQTNNVHSFAMDSNIYWDSRTSRPGKGKIKINGTPTDVDAWKRQHRQDANSEVVDPQFIANPEYNDFYPTSGHVLDKAIPIALDPVRPCGQGPDIGFLETCP